MTFRKPSHLALAGLLAGLLCVATAVVGAPPDSPADDPMARLLFPPDVVMRFQGEIGLEESQRSALKDLISKAQAKFLDLQFEMQPEAEKMARLLSAPSVEESTVLAQADKVMSLEREVKKAQLSLLILIKNLLSERQQAKLVELRKNGG